MRMPRIVLVGATPVELPVLFHREWRTAGDEACACDLDLDGSCEGSCRKKRCELAAKRQRAAMYLRPSYWRLIKKILTMIFYCRSWKYSVRWVSHLPHFFLKPNI